MIEIVVRLDSAEGILHYRSNGHANSTAVAAVKVCSALSALEYQFLYSVKMMCSELVKDFVIKDGYFQFQRKSLVAELESLKTYLILSKSLMIGVEMLKQTYSEQINVRISI